MTCIPYYFGRAYYRAIVWFMSFNIAVGVKDGHVSLTHSGDVPEGEFIIAGHEDDATRSLSVSRKGPDGRFVQVANATHHKGT